MQVQPNSHGLHSLPECALTYSLQWSISIRGGSDEYNNNSDDGDNDQYNDGVEQYDDEYIEDFISSFVYMCVFDPP